MSQTGTTGARERSYIKNVIGELSVDGGGGYAVL